MGGPALALAGGGTGGHVVPGLHLLEHLADRGTPPERVLWFGAGRPIEDRVLAVWRERLGDLPLTRETLALEPPQGGAPSRGRLLARLPPATHAARRVLARDGARVVLGLGGFTCLPVVLAARSLGLPVGLLEINAVAGSATRWLGPFATRVFHAWPSTLPAHPGARHLLVGPPLARAYAGGPPDEGERRRARAALGFDETRPLLLVLGGSQGAQSLNTFAREQASALLAGGLQVLHQTGPGRLVEGAEGGPLYRPCEYVDDMALALAGATLVLSRGGASTLAEIAARACPAWIVPYPHHADRHQERNALLLGDGVRIIPEVRLGLDLARELARAAGGAGREQRSAMARALAAAAVPDGSERLACALWELAGIAGGSRTRA